MISLIMSIIYIPCSLILLFIIQGSAKFSRAFWKGPPIGQFIRFWPPIGQFIRYWPLICELGSRVARSESSDWSTLVIFIVEGQPWYAKIRFTLNNDFEIHLILTTHYNFGDTLPVRLI